MDGDARTPPVVRVGHGFDVHRLVPGRRLVLGGVEIPFEMGLLGHSDADVLTHAICDAILGGVALGDIGQHFPPTDPAYKDISSIYLLRVVAGRAAERGFEVGNVDATVVAEAPRLAGHIPEMRAIIAGTLGIPTEDVNVKATTNEGLGFVGRREGIAAWAVVTLRAIRPSEEKK